MRKLYLDKIVDITDPESEFIRDFNSEIRKYGALVYNHENNTYQYIKSFDHIDYKKELLPDFIKVENSTPLLKAMTVTVHYDFDPETEEDEENLEIWEELKQIEIPVFEYDDDGEINVASYINLSPASSTHTIWFLKESSRDYIYDQDLLMISPMIKNINIARTLIKDHCVHPMEAHYDPKDLDNNDEPDLFEIVNGIYRKDEE